MNNPPHLHLKSDHPVVSVIATITPPVNGMNHVTEQIAKILTQNNSLDDCTISNQGKLPNSIWRIKKHKHFLTALIKRMLQTKPPQIAYFVADSNLGLIPNIFEAILLKLTFTKIYLHHHVFSYVNKYDWRMALIVKILGKDAVHITLCPTMTKLMKRHYALASILELGNACFVSNTDYPKHPKKGALTTVGFLGNVSTEKGIDIFIDTIEMFEANNKTQINAIIAGPINTKQLEKEVLSFVNLAPSRRKYVGPVYKSEKNKFFSDIDLLLFPSRYKNEALPVTIYESMSFGVPILATNIGGIGDQLCEASTTFPVEIFSSAAEKQILKWTINKKEFSDASKKTLELFLAQQAKDQAHLEALITQLQARRTETH